MTDRRPRVGFRVRVLGFAAGLLIIAMTTGLLVQRTVLLRRLDAKVEESLRQEKSEVDVLAAGRDPETGQPFAGDVAAIFDTFLRHNVPDEGEAFLTLVDGKPYKRTSAPLRLDQFPELVQRWAEAPTGEFGDVSTAAGPVRYLAVPLRNGDRTDGVFVVAHFLRGEREEIETTIRIAALVLGAVVLVAIGAAWVVAGRLLRPVRQLTDTARAITESDLTRRIPVEGDDEIAELARTFNSMLDRLAGAFASERAFIDDAGHELRTPITIVRGHLELMGDDPDERAATLRLVTDELDRMARIVDDLLLLAKAEQPDFLRFEVVEVSDLTTELLVKARALGDRAWCLDACAEGLILADGDRLTQAILNLGRNAVEHTGPHAEVAIGSARAAGSIRFWVRDRGTGVDEAERDRIFSRFARGRNASRRTGGAGLGLAIVRAIAEAHGGRVELESRPGEGATFSIVLPVRLPPSSPVSEDAVTDRSEAVTQDVQT
jgi:two-component system OmpR family sensor kinase